MQIKILSLTVKNGGALKDDEPKTKPRVEHFADY